MAKDFRASQIRTNKLIASGSTGTGAALLVYPSSSAADNEGGLGFVPFAGTDTFVFVSGAINSKDTAEQGVFVIGGDLHVSGNFTVDGTGGGSGSVFVFAPLGTPGGNVYDDWAVLHAAAAVIGRGVVVIIDTTDGPADIPAGTWNVDGWTFQGTIRPNPFGIGRETVTFEDGCVLVGSSLGFINIDIDTTSTAPVIDCAAPSPRGARIELRHSAIRGAGATIPLILGGTNTELHLHNSDIGDWVFRAASAPGSGDKDLLVFIHGVCSISDNAFSDNGYGGPPSWRLILHYFASPGYDSGELAGILQNASGPWTGWDSDNVLAHTYIPTRNEPTSGDVMTWDGSEWVAAPSAGPSIANTKLQFGSYAAITQSTPQVTGGGFYVAGENLTTSAHLRIIFSCGNASNLSHVRLFNITSASYVPLNGAAVELNTNSTTPIVLTSSNLIGASNFDDLCVYELHVSASGGGSPLVAFQHSAEIVFFA